MEVGTLVKVRLPKKQGKQIEREEYKIAKIIKIYKNFVLVGCIRNLESKEIMYKECYRQKDIIVIQEGDYSCEQRKRRIKYKNYNKIT